MNFEDLKVQGTKMHYYQVCKRKLWLFSKGITMEQTSDRVLQGKVLHEQTFKTKKKDFTIDDLVKIDLIDSEYIGEVKSSSQMSKADYMQLLYYLYYLKQYGIERKGRIHYVKEKKVEEVTLTEEGEKEVEKCLVDIKRIVQMDIARGVGGAVGSSASSSGLYRWI